MKKFYAMIIGLAVCIFTLVAIIFALTNWIDELELDSAKLSVCEKYKEDCSNDVHNLEERLEFTYDQLFACEDDIKAYKQSEAFWGASWIELSPESKRAIKGLVCENYVCEN